MRKIIVLTFISLDGVMQAPGGPDEDTSGGFRYGGWTVPHFDETLGEVMDEQIQPPFDLLLGRKTYDIFASYWPHQDEATSSIARIFNAAKKYVVSNRSFMPEWHNSELIHDDVVIKIKELKQQDGPDLQVHGSGEFIQTLLENDLVDELWLKIFPVTLGVGKRLFGDGTVPATYTLLSSRVSPSGVIVANYSRSGDVKTGSFA